MSGPLGWAGTLLPSGASLFVGSWESRVEAPAPCTTLLTVCTPNRQGPVRRCRECESGTQGPRQGCVQSHSTDSWTCDVTRGTSLRSQIPFLSVKTEVHYRTQWVWRTVCGKP